MLLSAALLIAATTVTAQQGGAGGKGKGNVLGNLLTGIGAKLPIDAITLLNNAAVQKELKVTDEQKGKIAQVARKAASEILDNKQMKRLREIEYQQMGNYAFLDPDVKKELNISEAQSKKIKDAIEGQLNDQKEMLNNFDFASYQETMQAITKKADDAVQAALTPAQKALWEDILGKEFNLPAGGLGGLVGGFGGKKN